MSISTIVLDNTTFAAAGRVMYRSHRGAPGHDHASSYYQCFPQQIGLDKQSFLQLLAALLLFDKIQWNGSSDVQESPEMPDTRDSRGWVYDWFPIFVEVADEFNALSVRSKKFIDDSRLRVARSVASHWVLRSAGSLNDVLPAGFLLPLIYGDPHHLERPALVAQLRDEGLELNEQQLGLALFMSRGLFYQADALAKGASYLPHANRGVLLSQPGVAALSLYCTEDVVFGEPKLDGATVLREVEQVFSEEIRRARGFDPAEFGSPISLAIVRSSTGDPQQQMRKLLQFRDSDAGRSIRQSVRELLQVAGQQNRQALDARLERLRAQLADIQREKTGYASGRSWAEDLIDGGAGTGLGKLKFVLAPFKRILPLSVKERLTRIGAKTFWASGFQVLFAEYFSDQGSAE